MTTIPIIRTERLTLRPFRSDDSESLFQILNGRNVLRYFPSAAPPTRQQVERLISSLQRHWQEHEYGLWAVQLANDGPLIGRCGLQFLEETGEVEIDFILGRHYWRHGYATEAAKSALNYGFDPLGLHEVVGIVHTANLASQHVLEKLQMHNKGRARYFGMDCYRYVGYSWCASVELYERS